MCKAQRRLWNVLFETGVCEDACVRDSDEKQPFFDRQIQQVNACEVRTVESPNASRCKDDIPRDEKNHGQEARRPKGLPLFKKCNTLVKAGYEWDENDTQVDPQVCPFAHLTSFYSATIVSLLECNAAEQTTYQNTLRLLFEDTCDEPCVLFEWP